MIWINDARHGLLIARAASTSFDPQVDRCISRVTNEHGFLGGFIFTGYTGSMIMVHMAGNGGHWASSQLLWTCFDYAFEQLRVRKVLATIGSRNLRAVGLVERCGFLHEYSIDDGIPNGQLHLFSLLRQDCRWLKLDRRYKRVNGSSHNGERVYAAT